jgi:hypothetical protein
MRICEALAECGEPIGNLGTVVSTSVVRFRRETETRLHAYRALIKGITEY